MVASTKATGGGGGKVNEIVRTMSRPVYVIKKQKQSFCVDGVPDSGKTRGSEQRLVCGIARPVGGEQTTGVFLNTFNA